MSTLHPKSDKVELGYSNRIKNSSVVSVVVACKEPPNHIAGWVEKLVAQASTWPIEFLVVDDHSPKTTARLLLTFSEQDKIRYYPLEEGESGKKTAIDRGVSYAIGDAILFTDADSFPTSDWVQTLMQSRIAQEAQLLLAPVVLQRGKTKAGLWWLQFGENILLQTITFGAARLGIPSMCNGANLLVSKDIFHAYMKDGRGREYASGDDMFLLDYAIDTSQNIGFCFSSKAAVSTNAVGTWRAYYQQRRRWLSKQGGYRSRGLKKNIWLTGIVGSLLPLTLALTLYFWSAYCLAGVVLLLSIQGLICMQTARRWVPNRGFLPVLLALVVVPFLTGIIYVDLLINGRYTPWKN